MFSFNNSGGRLLILKDEAFKEIFAAHLRLRLQADCSAHQHMSLQDFLFFGLASNNNVWKSEGYTS